MKVDYGAVALIPKGEFDATEQYAVNDLVSYNGSSFIVKAVPPIGTLPTNTAYFTINASGTSPATSSTVGTVKPDNSTIGVDNNGVISVKSEVLDRVSSSEQALTVNLLNPTLGSQTKNEVTITRNSDNTYTLNGTATKNTHFPINVFTATKNQNIRITGCPQGGSQNTFYFSVQKTDITETVRDFGDGAIKQLLAGENYNCVISINSGYTCDNLVFKPMLTTNLSATYDDFVPFSGSSGKLDTDFKTLSEKIGNVGNTDLQSQLNAATQSIAQNTTDIAATETKAETNRVNIARVDGKVIFTDIGDRIVAGNVYNSQGTGENVTYRDVLDTTSNSQTLRTWFSSVMKFGMERYVDGALQEGWHADLRKIPFLFYPNSNDLNAITNYSCGWINGNAVNAPSGSSLYGIVTTFGVDLDATLTAIQLWVDSENRFYGRIKVGSTWKAWRSL